MIMTLFAYWGIGLPVGYSLGLTDWIRNPPDRAACGRAWWWA